MSHIRKILRYLQNRPMLADLLAIVGMAVYIFMLWILAHNQVSVLDEGLYLYKGWLFSTGRYTPFQTYGAWTNQMPLAFLIPGWVELLLGPGLRTGRIMAIVLGTLMLPGLWLTARRLSGSWIAAGVVMALALNPAALRMVTLAASQGLVACILAWTMWFSLGSDRKNWQLLAGGLLAGCAVMVRINLLPLLPLLALYVLWERGWKAMFWSLGGMLVIFGGLHLIYWPNILKLWAKWLPFGFLKAWFPPKTIPTWNPDNPLAFRIASFFLAFRYHFAALAGSLATWIFWPTGKPPFDLPHYKNRYLPQSEYMPGAATTAHAVEGRVHGMRPYSERYKAAVFLSVLLIVFFLLHAWAALGNEYCVFCFPTYTAFYAGLGLLLTAVALPMWNLNPPVWRKWLGGVSFLALLAGMAYSAEGAAESMLGKLFYKRLLTTQLPGLNGAQIWQVLANKFQLDYELLYDSTHTWFPVFITVVFGLAVFILLYAARFWVSPGYSTGSALARPRSSAPLGIVFLLLLGSVLAPIPVLAGDYNSYDCNLSDTNQWVSPGSIFLAASRRTGWVDVIPRYEAAGALLEKLIPPGSKVFWAGYSPVVLLYLPGVEIYPAQLHGTYSFRISTDDDALLKYGWWNEHLAENWLNEADFVLAEQKNLGKNSWLNTAGRLDNYELVTQSAPQTCQDTTVISLYRRK